ncbi:MAG: hypothetical protein AAB871_01530 [Patescibacteria group bacterium]
MDLEIIAARINAICLLNCPDLSPHGEYLIRVELAGSGRLNFVRSDGVIVPAICWEADEKIFFQFEDFSRTVVGVRKRQLLGELN